MNRKIKNFKVLEKGYMLGSADIEVNDITIYNVRLMEKDGVRFLGFPSYKGKDGKYYKFCNIKGETYNTLLGDLIYSYSTQKYDDLEPTDDTWEPQEDDRLPF